MRKQGFFLFAFIGQELHRVFTQPSHVSQEKKNSGNGVWQQRRSSVAGTRLVCPNVGLHMNRKKETRSFLNLLHLRSFLHLPFLASSTACVHGCMLLNLSHSRVATNLRLHQASYRTRHQFKTETLLAKSPTLFELLILNLLRHLYSMNKSSSCISRLWHYEICILTGYII